MKIKQMCMLVLLWLGVIPAMQAQTFDKLWKEVEQAEKKSLPQTVIKLTGEIYQKGEMGCVIENVIPTFFIFSYYCLLLCKSVF